MVIKKVASVGLVSIFVVSRAFGLSTAHAGESIDTPAEYRFFVSAEAGVSINSDPGRSTVQWTNGAAPLTYEIGDMGTSKVYGLGGGITLPYGLSVDVKGKYRPKHNMHAKSVSGPASVSETARVSSKSVMANLRYTHDSFDTFGFSVKPFVTGGVGYARNSVEKSIADANFGINIVPYDDAKSSNNFAWQVGAGAEIPLNEDVSLGLVYRYVDLGEFKSGSVASEVTDSGRDPTLKDDYVNHEVTLEFVYKF